MAMIDQSAIFRRRALASESRARQAAAPALKREWEEIAIQWHSLAHAAAEVAGEISDTDTA